VYHSIHDFLGAHVCSDALDVEGNWLMSGSWQTKEQVQLWDLQAFAIVRVLR
jgi:hypothetical protein